MTISVCFVSRCPCAWCGRRPRRTRVRPHRERLRR